MALVVCTVESKTTFTALILKRDIAVWCSKTVNLENKILIIMGAKTAIPSAHGIDIISVKIITRFKFFCFFTLSLSPAIAGIVTQAIP